MVEIWRWPGPLGTQARPKATAAKKEGFPITEEIRRVLGEYARLVVDVADLSDDADLFRLGMTSHASVSVMLALEDAFGVEFPERMLRKSTFESISSIRQAITELLETASGD
ncbi:MAG: acyl carrier protein [Acidimicrobiales bacterium]